MTVQCAESEREILKKKKKKTHWAPTIKIHPEVGSSLSLFPNVHTFLKTNKNLALYILKGFPTASCKPSLGREEEDVGGGDPVLSQPLCLFYSVFFKLEKEKEKTNKYYKEQ